LQEEYRAEAQVEVQEVQEVELAAQEEDLVLHHLLHQVAEKWEDLQAV
jgi:hypothetical protein